MFPLVSMNPHLSPIFTRANPSRKPPRTVFYAHKSCKKRVNVVELWVDDVVSLRVNEPPLAADPHASQSFRERPSEVELRVDDDVPFGINKPFLAADPYVR